MPKKTQRKRRGLRRTQRKRRGVRKTQRRRQPKRRGGRMMEPPNNNNNNKKARNPALVSALTVWNNLSNDNNSNNSNNNNSNNSNNSNIPEGDLADLYSDIFDLTDELNEEKLKQVATYLRQIIQNLRDSSPDELSEIDITMPTPLLTQTERGDLLKIANKFIDAAEDDGDNIDKIETWLPNNLPYWNWNLNQPLNAINLGIQNYAGYTPAESVANTNSNNSSSNSNNSSSYFSSSNNSNTSSN